MNHLYFHCWKKHIILPLQRGISVETCGHNITGRSSLRILTLETLTGKDESIFYFDSCVLDSIGIEYDHNTGNSIKHTDNNDKEILIQALSEPVLVVLLGGEPQPLTPNVPMWSIMLRGLSAWSTSSTHESLGPKAAPVPQSGCCSHQYLLPCPLSPTCPSHTDLLLASG